jgi:hypothetical protein
MTQSYWLMIDENKASRSNDVIIEKVYFRNYARQFYLLSIFLYKNSHVSRSMAVL